MRLSLVSLAVTVMTVLGLPSSSGAQAGRADVREGNRLYREGRYEEAHEQYLEALRAAPESPLIRFNDANALYQFDEFARAVDAYRGAIEAADPVLEARAWYNLGNALYRQQQVEGALDAYKEALRRNPDDTDAKHNLEVALEQLQRQQQQERQNQDPQQQEQPEDSDPEQDEREADADGQDPSPESQQSAEQPPGERPPEESPEGGRDERREEGRQPAGDPSDRETGEAEGEPQPGEMSREEAERLLQAITEDPGQIRRQHRSADPGRRTRRPW